MISGNSGWTKLNDAAQTLADRWDQTDSGWRDQKRLEFERDCIEPIESAVESTLRAMKDLSDVLARVRRDCRDDDEF